MKVAVPDEAPPAGGRAAEAQLASNRNYTCKSLSVFNTESVGQVMKVGKLHYLMRRHQRAVRRRKPSGGPSPVTSRRSCHSWMKPLAVGSSSDHLFCSRNADTPFRLFVPSSVPNTLDELQPDEASGHQIQFQPLPPCEKQHLCSDSR